MSARGKSAVQPFALFAKAAIARASSPLARAIGQRSVRCLRLRSPTMAEIMAPQDNAQFEKVMNRNGLVRNDSSLEEKGEKDAGEKQDGVTITVRRSAGYPADCLGCRGPQGRPSQGRQGGRGSSRPQGPTHPDDCGASPSRALSDRIDRRHYRHGSLRGLWSGAGDGRTDRHPARVSDHRLGRLRDDGRAGRDVRRLSSAPLTRSGPRCSPSPARGCITPLASSILR